MIRTLLLPALAPLSLAACTAHGAPVADRSPTVSPTLAGECGAQSVTHHLNALPSNRVLAQIRRTSGAHSIRVIRPGDVVTMDYRPDRLNVEVGEDGRIKRLRCG